MTSPTGRAILFWTVCIPLRLYLARQGDNPYLRAAAAVIAYRWLSGRETAHTGFFGGQVWWANERPLHGLLWAAYAATGRDAFLYADVTVGALNYLT